MALPGLQLRAARDAESDVVEAGPSLREALARVSVMVVQDDDQAHLLVGQELPDASLVGLLHPVADAEDPRVPVDARLQVRDGERDVVQVGQRKVRHDVLPMPILRVLPWPDPGSGAAPATIPAP